MNKEEIKKMLCEAIDNIPNCANILDCYIEHGLYSPIATIKVEIGVKDQKKQTLISFNDVAHKSFGTKMKNVG